MSLKYIDINEIEYDVDNPRIRNALKKYGGKNITPEKMYFALKTAGSNGEKSSSMSNFSELKTSIQASGGIHNAIKVVQKNGKKVCIDGNTRLGIYKDLLKHKAKGDWSKIKTEIVEVSNDLELDEIRISAHLVGSRDWPAYEKAYYLHKLRYTYTKSYDRIIEIAGGNKKEIQRTIDAYEDMNEYYKDKFGDESFKRDRFSSFVELQKIKQDIFDAGFELEDFGKWIHKGKIRKNADTRRLPEVLRDEEAKKEFLSDKKHSIEEAIAIVDQKKRKKFPKGIDDANIYQLATVLTQKIGKLPFDEVSILKNNESGESTSNIETLQDLFSKLQILLDSVSE